MWNRSKRGRTVFRFHFTILEGILLEEMGLLGGGVAKERRVLKKRGEKKESSLMNVTNRKIVGLFLSLALKVMINDSTRKR